MHEAYADGCSSNDKQQTENKHKIADGCSCNDRKAT